MAGSARSGRSGGGGRRVPTIRTPRGLSLPTGRRASSGQWHKQPGYAPPPMLSTKGPWLIESSMRCCCLPRQDQLLPPPHNTHTATLCYVCGRACIAGYAGGGDERTGDGASQGRLGGSRACQPPRWEGSEMLVLLSQGTVEGRSTLSRTLGSSTTSSGERDV